MRELSESQKEYPMIRPTIIESFIGHVQKGIPTGSFVYAVLCNDLKESFGQADDGNRKTLFNITQFCYWELPSDCWGSPEKVKAWQEQFKSEGKDENSNLNK